MLHQWQGHDLAWTHVGATNDVITLHHPDLASYGAGAQLGSLWVIARKLGGITSLQIINLRGITTDRWNVAHEVSPQPMEDVELRVQTLGGISAAWWDTPDDEVGLPRPVSFVSEDESGGRVIRLRIPRIDVWSMVWWVEEEWRRASDGELEEAPMRSTN